jgi:hypothetical protein
MQSTTSCAKNSNNDTSKQSTRQLYRSAGKDAHEEQRAKGHTRDTKHPQKTGLHQTQPVQNNILSKGGCNCALVDISHRCAAHHRGSIRPTKSKSWNRKMLMTGNHVLPNEGMTEVMPGNSERVTKNTLHTENACSATFLNTP